MADIKFTGNLGRDAELKYTRSGSPYMNFSVADSKSRKTESGDWETLAEHYDGKLTRGSRVTIYGDFMARKYESKDGTPGVSLDVTVKGVDILPSKNSRNQSATSGGNGAAHGGLGGNQPATGNNSPDGWGNGPADAEPPF